MSLCMTSIQMESVPIFVTENRVRSDAHAIDLDTFSSHAQAAHTAEHLKSLLIRTLRGSGVEFLQLITYRRSQNAAVLWSELPDTGDAGDIVPPFAEAIARRSMISGAPEIWTLERAEAQTQRDEVWLKALNKNALTTGLAIALFGANDTCHVFHFAAHDAANLTVRQAGPSISTISFIVSQRLLSWQKPPFGSTSVDARLSARELEVIRWCKDGKSYPEIARILGISAKTVEFHIANVMRKLGVNQKISAIIEAARQGLIAL